MQDGIGVLENINQIIVWCRICVKHLDPCQNRREQRLKMQTFKFNQNELDYVGS